MKKLIFVLMVVGIVVCPNAFATGDKTITSQKYVENQLATKQDKIPAVDTNTVITHTGTNGEIGEKGIYDSTGNYAEQQTALVTAGDANTGINTALENEFICIEEDTDGTCLIWKIKNTYQERILPEGYTALEYIKGDKHAYIDTGKYLTTNSSFQFQFSTDAQGNYAVFGASNGNFYDKGEISLFWNYISLGHVIEAVYPLSNTTSYIVMPRPNIIANQKYNITYDKTKLMVNGTSYPKSWYSDYVGQRTMYLFGTNRGNANPYMGNNELYWFKLFESGVLVANYIPARRDSDGVLGMYDTVSNTFFTNSGSGNFIAGPDLDVYIPSGN